MLARPSKNAKKGPHWRLHKGLRKRLHKDLDVSSIAMPCGRVVESVVGGFMGRQNLDVGSGSPVLKPVRGCWGAKASILGASGAQDGPADASTDASSDASNLEAFFFAFPLPLRAIL